MASLEHTEEFRTTEVLSRNDFREFFAQVLEGRHDYRDRQEAIYTLRGEITYPSARPFLEPKCL